MRWERVVCLLTEGLKADGGPYDGDVANAVPLYLKWLSAGPPEDGEIHRALLVLGTMTADAQKLSDFWVPATEPSPGRSSPLA